MMTAASRTNAMPSPRAQSSVVPIHPCGRGSATSASAAAAAADEVARRDASSLMAPDHTTPGSHDPLPRLSAPPDARPRRARTACASVRRRQAGLLGVRACAATALAARARRPRRRLWYSFSLYWILRALICSSAAARDGAARPRPPACAGSPRARARRACCRGCATPQAARRRRRPPVAGPAQRREVRPGVRTGSLASTTARSIAFSSSRTLPGQGWPQQQGQRLVRDAAHVLAVRPPRTA